MGRKNRRSGCGGEDLFVFKLGADLGEFLRGEVEGAAVLPGFVVGHEVNVGVGDIGADDFPKDAGAEFVFHVFAELLDGGHEGLIILVREVVDFVNLLFGDDEGVTLSLGVDVEEGVSFVVLVDFVGRDVAVDDLGENAGHSLTPLVLNVCTHYITDGDYWSSKKAPDWRDQSLA